VGNSWSFSILFHTLTTPQKSHLQAKLLHGEQYLKILGPIPTGATLVNEVKLMEVLDKGKAATVTSITTTTDKATGKPLFENQSTVMLRGSGGFGGKKSGSGEC
jgi:multifunctional beta-oxidation protein